MSEPSVFELPPELSPELSPKLSPTIPAPARHPNAPVKKYLIGVLYYGPVDREHDQCIKALKGHPYVHDVLEMTGCPYIDIGRSIIATYVLDHPEVGGLVFIDHDMLFDPSEVAKVIESAEVCQGTAGAAYSMRRPGKIIGGIDLAKIEPGKKIVFFQGGELLPAQYLGMGMTAIHRTVFERLVEASRARHELQECMLGELRGILAAVFENAGKFTPLTGPDFDSKRPLELLEALAGELKIPDLPRLSSGISEAPVVPFFSLLQREAKAAAPHYGYYFGEDVSFCIRCHDQALPITLDTRARVFHKGGYAYGLEDVGMQVPWCDTLVALDGKGDAALPKPAWFSADPAIQAALDETYGGDAASRARSAPESPLPASFDPTDAPSP